MDVVKDIITPIVYTIVTALAGYLAIAIKNLYNKYVTDKTKQQVVSTCVKAVEQLYKDLHGEEKLNKCIESVAEIFAEKGISISSLELRMLIEAAVNKFNSELNKNPTTSINIETEA